MAKRDIIVIGASAGGVETLLSFVNSLPNGLNAAVFVVVHLSPFSKSNLPRILGRKSSLKALHPKDGEEIQHGHIYIAPPDHHLLLEKGNKIIVRRPKRKSFSSFNRCLVPLGSLVVWPKSNWSYLKRFA